LIEGNLLETIGQKDGGKEKPLVWVGDTRGFGEGHQNRRMKKREGPPPVQVGKALQYDVDIDPKVASLLLWCVSR
jgi:hypothetical protein